MATFSHSVTWLVNIDGRSTTYSYTYDVTDVVNVQRISALSSDLQSVVLTQEPVLTAFFNAGDTIPGAISLAETSGPTSVNPGYLWQNDMFIAHQSDAGGVWNSTGSAATATLEPLDSISVGGVGSTRPANFELLILHQAGS